MIHRFLKKYLSIIFVLATLLGASHVHKDGLTHSDCQICTVQLSLVDGDTPAQTTYLIVLDKHSESLDQKFQNLYSQKCNSPLNARAPPFISL